MDRTSPVDSSKARVPKLPFFTEKDELDAYLERFERFARAVKWPEDTWAGNLSALLTGKALEVYSRLAADDANDYNHGFYIVSTDFIFYPRILYCFHGFYILSVQFE